MTRIERRSAAASVAVLALVGVLAGCGHRGGTSDAGAGLSTTIDSSSTSVSSSTAPPSGAPSTTAVTSATSGAVRSAGCSAPAAAATSGSVVVDGETRTFRLALPADPSKPAPVILDLHGLGESGAAQYVYSGLSTAGPAAGMIVATPDSDNAVNSWTVPPLESKDSDFMAAILDQLEATRCVDRSREVSAGISNGAGLSDGLICSLNGRLAAIFPVSGINLVKPCATARPTTIITFHGTADPIVPYDGGGLFSGLPGGLGGATATALLGPALQATFAHVNLQPVETATAGWAQQFRCGAATDTTAATGVRLRTYPGCHGNATVQLYTITGGGHTWPGATITGRARLGATTHAISATQLIVAAVGSLTTRR